ncbi:AMP-dependent synthetase/ligase [Tanacetum coccineum]
MDIKYKKIIGNLSVHLAATTLKVKSSCSHRIGVNGKGILNIYDDINAFPNQKIFHLGIRYSVIIRHSNSLSAYDDARLDAHGAAMRILLSEVAGQDYMHVALKDEMEATVCRGCYSIAWSWTISMTSTRYSVSKMKLSLSIAWRAWYSYNQSNPAADEDFPDV